MKYIPDTLLMAADGLISAYSASGPMHSPITGLTVMTHRLFPGLGSLVKTGTSSVVMMYVNKLQKADQVRGVIFPINRGSEKGEHFLVHVESGFNAWQFIIPAESVSDLDDHIIFCEWIAGSLNHAVALHDKVISELWNEEDMLIGSNIEKQALSRFSLASGVTSIFHPFATMGYLKEAIRLKGKALEVEMGGCRKMQARSIEWLKIVN